MATRKRCLITGGVGLIGSHLVDLLLEKGHDARILDNLDPQTHPNGKPDWMPDVPWYRHDLASPDTQLLSRAVAGCDWVFHQAAFGGFAPSPAKMTEVNCSGTARLLSECRRHDVSKVVVASSQAVYGRRKDPEPVTEAGPFDLPTVYALSKFYAERMALTLGEQWGLPVVALRYALTYGPRQSVHNPYTGICSIFSTRLLNGLPPIVYEDGHQTRDFTYVTDVAAANLRVAEEREADGQVFNVGTGRATPVLYFVGLLQDAYGTEVLCELPGSSRPADARHLVTDATALRSLGWEPKVRVEEGVRRYAEWFLTQSLPADLFTEAEKGLVEEGVVVPA